MDCRCSAADMGAVAAAKFVGRAALSPGFEGKPLVGIERLYRRTEPLRVRIGLTGHPHLS